MKKILAYVTIFMISFSATSLFAQCCGSFPTDETIFKGTSKDTAKDDTQAADTEKETATKDTSAQKDSDKKDK